jgi:hypothetical protein
MDELDRGISNLNLFETTDRINNSFVSRDLDEVHVRQKVKSNILYWLHPDTNLTSFAHGKDVCISPGRATFI